MKKMVKLLHLIFSFSCILIFASCLNSAGENTEDKTIVFQGSFEVEESLLRRIERASYASNDFSRSAQPSLPSSITYYAKAVNKVDSNDPPIDSLDLDETTGTFSIPLKTGAVWIIEVGAKGVSALDSSITEAVLIKDTFEFNPANATEPRVDHTFYLAPYVTQTGKGYLNLQINIENPLGNKISKVEIEPKKNIAYPDDESAITSGWSSFSSGWDSTTNILTFTSGLDTNLTATISIQKNDFSSGIWETAINFKDKWGQLLFSSAQIIGVYDNLETNKWESSKTTTSTNELIKNGNFRLTTQLVDSYGLTDFYVDGHEIPPGEEDTATGSPGNPFATISRAISVVNGISRMDKTYSIHVKNEISETCDSELVVQSNVSIECYKDSYGDRKGSATIWSTSPAAIIKIERSEIGSSSLTIEGVKKEDGWSGLILENGSGRTPSADTRGIEISDGCSLYMNGGEISGNRIAGSTAHGVGVYVGTNAYFSMSGGTIKENCTVGSMVGNCGNGGGIYISDTGEFVMKGGIITTNTAAAGGGVYNAGTMTISGMVAISANTNLSDLPSNVYLPTGKLIKINGKLQTTGVPSIGVTTQDVPDVGVNVRFTEGYAYGKEWGKNKTDDGSDIHPFNYFISDVSDYSILTDQNPNASENTGDVYLGTSGGKITQKDIPEITLGIARDSANDEVDKICYQLSWYHDRPLDTGYTITIGAELKCKGVAVPSALWFLTSTNKLYLQKTLPAGKYNVEVELIYKDPTYFPAPGLVYAASLEIEK